MDPTQTLSEALIAIAGGDMAKAVEALGDLREWIERGGRMPDLLDPRITRWTDEIKSEYQPLSRLSTWPNKR